MIPLIDVSLVLLVFFIMTAGAIAYSNIALPEASNNLLVANPDMIWIGIQAIEADPTERPSYSIGTGDQAAADDDKGLTEQQVLEQLDARLKERGGKPVEVQIKASGDLPEGYVLQMQVALEQRRGVIVKKYLGVNEKKS
jgi:biopolymer transport protein ExbD